MGHAQWTVDPSPKACKAEMEIIEAIASIEELKEQGDEQGEGDFVSGDEVEGAFSSESRERGAQQEERRRPAGGEETEHSPKRTRAPGGGGADELRMKAILSTAIL